MATFYNRQTELNKTTSTTSSSLSSASASSLAGSTLSERTESDGSGSATLKKDLTQPSVLIKELKAEKLQEGEQHDDFTQYENDEESEKYRIRRELNPDQMSVTLPAPVQVDLEPRSADSSYVSLTDQESEGSLWNCPDCSLTAVLTIAQQSAHSDFHLADRLQKQEDEARRQDAQRQAERQAVQAKRERLRLNQNPMDRFVQQSQNNSRDRSAIATASRAPLRSSPVKSKSSTLSKKRKAGGSQKGGKSVKRKGHQADEISKFFGCWLYVSRVVAGIIYFKKFKFTTTIIVTLIMCVL